MPFISSPGGMVWVPEQKKAEPKANSVDLSGKSILIMDRGLYAYLAPFMARYFGTVYYHCITGGAYESAPQSHIGKGIDKVHHLESPWSYINSVDVIFFPDVCDGDMQSYFRRMGHAVCGSGSGEMMELDKLYFHNSIKAAGLPVADMHLCKGLDEVYDYCAKHEAPLYLKCRDRYRDDWETTRYDNMFDLECFLNDKRAHLGVKRSKEIEILVYSPIESECEAGVDGFRLGGQMADNCCCGYEVKDKGFVAKIFSKPPKIMQEVLDKTAGIYAGTDYQGPYSNEVRITAKGEAYPIDETCRCGSPPTELLCEMYGESYAQAVWLLAHGELPTVKPVATYGAQVVLESKHHCGCELHVAIPKEIEQWVKLKNYSQRDGEYYCTENGNEGIFGSVVAIGNSIEEATKLCIERIQMITARGMKYHTTVFDEAAAVIENGKRFGIGF